MAVVRAETSCFEFHIWERLKLTVGDEGKEGSYICRVTDIENNRLVISRPHFERGKSLLADNRIVTAYCTRADAAYAFSARIKETRPKSSDTMYLINLGAVQRVQRRRFVRLVKRIRLKYMALSRPLKTVINPSSTNFIAARSINLSAGGILITIDRDLTTEDILFFVLENCRLKKLPPYLLGACRHVGMMENKQRVAGVELILNEDLPRYLNASELALIPEAATQFDDRMQNELVTEIFSEQLAMRQKGLL